MWKLLGVINLLLLFFALGLSGLVLTQKYPKQKVFLISGTVLALMITVTALSVIIYLEYGG